MNVPIFVMVAGLLSVSALADQAAVSPGVAVVELFSSEGCSSCPPAEDHLNDLVRVARDSGEPVYALAFHVHYWNRLGWTDRFSSEAYTQRQRAYAKALKLKHLYTPQMVVNGSTQFSGADRTAARAAITLARKHRAEHGVALTWSPEQAPGAVRLDVDVMGPRQGRRVQVALAESGLITRVQAGENKGRTLKHENVVRAFASEDLPETGPITFELVVPADLVRANAIVIAYVQNGDAGAITGAASVRLK